MLQSFWRYLRSPLQIRHLTVPLPGLPRGLEGLRAVLFADLHRGPLVSRAYLLRVMERVNELEPDLILIPGDFVEPGGYIPDCARILGRLRARLGVFGVLGNHDHWAGRERARRLYPLTLLDNRRVFLTAGREVVTEPPELGLCLAGVEDYRCNHPDLRLALAGVPERLPRLLLCHNPDFAEDTRALGTGLRVDLMLSGHTHGGQIRIPGWGTPITSSRFGSRYAGGLVQGPGWPVYVTRGVGCSGLPLRLGVSPELTVLKLVNNLATTSEQMVHRPAI